jgi:hypothetical protein
MLENPPKNGFENSSEKKMENPPEENGDTFAANMCKICGIFSEINPAGLKKFLNFLPQYKIQLLDVFVRRFLR